MDYTASRIEAHVDAVVSARPPAEVLERERRKLGMLLDSAAKGGLAGGGRGAVTWALVRAPAPFSSALCVLGAACFGAALGIGARNRREVRDGGQG